MLDPGEGSKSWAGLARLTEWLLERGVERSDHVVALGGGVIGDLAGFAAAILKRGCGFVQVPTTLLAQVDSQRRRQDRDQCSGGQEPHRRLPPAGAGADRSRRCSTLPPRELRAGYAEVVKYGLIDDAAFFAWCEENGAALIAGDGAARHKAIAHSVAAKARIVAADERETQDVRALLNLGHTFGHALEAETGFSDRLLHGEAVAAGMALALRFSAASGLCSVADADRVAGASRAVGLPMALPARGSPPMEPHSLAIWRMTRRCAAANCR